MWEMIHTLKSLQGATCCPIYTLGKPLLPGHQMCELGSAPCWGPILRFNLVRGKRPHTVVLLSVWELLGSWPHSELQDNQPRTWKWLIKLIPCLHSPSTLFPSASSCNVDTAPFRAALNHLGLQRTCSIYCFTFHQQGLDLHRGV